MVTRHSNGEAQGRGSIAGRRWGMALAALGFVATLGCSPLEPMLEPEESDLQLTVDTLKSTIRDAQRTIVDLRAELDARRQELAEAQIARAQLEGRVREAERRLVESRHVIDLQREELAGSRSERERVSRTGAALQHQLKQLQQQLSKLGHDARGTGIAPAGMPPQRRPSAPPRVDPSGPLAAPALHVPNGPGGATVPAAPARISVQAGDTLWSIARRYRIPVKRLMAMNQLSDSRIQAGQVLWLSESAAAGAQGDESAP